MTTYLATPVCTLTTRDSGFDERQKDLRDVLDVHPGVNIRATPRVERRPGLNARRVQRRLVNTNSPTGTRAPPMDDGRAHDRGFYSCRRLPRPLDEHLGVKSRVEKWIILCVARLGSAESSAQPAEASRSNAKYCLCQLPNKRRCIIEFVAMVGDESGRDRVTAWLG